MSVRADPAAGMRALLSTVARDLRARRDARGPRVVFELPCEDAPDADPPGRYETGGVVVLRTLVVGLRARGA